MQFKNKKKIVAIASCVLAMLFVCAATFAGAYNGARSSLESPSRITATPPSVSQPSQGLYSGLSDLIGMNDFGEKLSEGIIKEIERNVEAVSYGSIFSNGFMTYYRDFHFSGGYFLDYYWRSDDKLENYPSSITLDIGGSTCTVALQNSTEQYANDAAVLKGLQEAIGSMTDSKYGQRDWTASFFVLDEVNGPHTASADELMLQMYTQGKEGFFMAVLPQVSQEKIIEMIGTACADNKEDYVWLLSDYLPENYDTSELSRTAFENGNADLLYCFMDGTRQEVFQELLTLALQRGDYDMIEQMYYAGDCDEKSANEGALNAYEKNDFRLFSVFCYDISDETARQIAEKAYQDGRLDFFSEIYYVLDWSELGAFYEKAIAEGKTAFAAFLREEIFG